MKKQLFIVVAIVFGIAIQATALNIYPINQAQILAGSKFDFKVELDGITTDKDVIVTINGNDYRKVLGKTAAFISEEQGIKASALMLREVRITKAGTYTVAVKNGESTKTVTWTVYPTVSGKAKNVIFLLGDGFSVGHRTAARLLAKGNTEGTSNGLMAYDQMDHMGALGTSSVDAITVDSANSMSSYMTGHKGSINGLGVYADRTKDPFDDPKVETIAEIIRRTTHKSIGIVSDAELEDATPAAVVSHTRIRDEKAAIVPFFLAIKPEVLLGGGSAYFLPKSMPGSKRKDNDDYLDKFQKAGYTLATTRTELAAIPAAKTANILGLFHLSNMDGALDRLFLKQNTVPQFNDQPDLTEMMKTALAKLETNKAGFFLMVEAGLIDKFSHPMDWDRSVYDTIMYDQCIAIAQEFAKKHPDTLIIVTGDHTHSISVFGTVDDTKPGTSMREKVGSYQAAGFPNYTHNNGSEYPDTVYPTKRLAVGWGNHPDYWETFAPHMDGTFSPTVKDEKGNYIANDKYKSDSAVLIAGNLSPKDSTEVHSVDDMIACASGPGSEKLKVYQENTYLFRIMAESLGLKP